MQVSFGILGVRFQASRLRPDSPCAHPRSTRPGRCVAALCALHPGLSSPKPTAAAVRPGRSATPLRVARNMHLNRTAMPGRARAGGRAARSGRNLAAAGGTDGSNGRRSPPGISMRTNPGERLHRGHHRCRARPFQGFPGHLKGCQQPHLPARLGWNSKHQPRGLRRAAERRSWHSKTQGQRHRRDHFSQSVPTIRCCSKAPWPGCIARRRALC